MSLSKSLAVDRMNAGKINADEVIASNLFSGNATVAPIGGGAVPSGNVVVFKDYSSYSKDGDNLPEYTLANGKEGNIKTLKLSNPLAGNVKINTELGSFNLTNSSPIAELIFTGGRWKVVGGTVSFYPEDIQNGGSALSYGLEDYAIEGKNVSISADGNTLAAAAEELNVGGSDRGGTFIYVRDGAGNWIPQNNGIALSHGSEDDIYEGWSISLSADGNTLAAGAIGLTVGGISRSGGTFIYVRDSAGNWTTQNGGDALSSGGAEATIYEGSSVSLSANGNTLAAGAESLNGDGTNRGGTFIYVRDSIGNWSLQTADPLSYNDIDRLGEGRAVSLSADGNTLAAGVYGGTFIYVRDSAGNWSRQTTDPLAYDAVTYTSEGVSVSLSADGNTLAAGINRIGLGGSNRGGALVYVRDNNGNWSRQTTEPLSNNLVDGANEGRSVSLSADGNTLAVGANGLNGTFIHVRDDNGVWTTQNGGNAISNGVIGSNEGRSVSLSADGNVLAVGSFTLSNGGSDRGGTFIYA